MKTFLELFYTHTERIYDGKQNLRRMPLFIRDPENDDVMSIVALEYDPEEPELYIRLYYWFLPQDFWHWSVQDRLEYRRTGWRDDYKEKSVLEEHLSTLRSRDQYLANMAQHERQKLEDIVDAFLLREE